MATEDFTSYTETDPNNHLSQTAARSTFSGLTRGESCYLYKDKGAGHFDLSQDFEHLFDFRITSIADRSFVNLWSLWNALGDLYDNKVVSDGLVVLFYHSSTSTREVGCRIYKDGDQYSSTRFTISADTTYYVKIIWTASTNTLELRVYTDAARTNLLGSTSVSQSGVDNLRYIMVPQSGTTDTYVNVAISGYVENLDLQEVSTYTKTWQSNVLFKKLGITKTAVVDTAFKKPNITKAFTLDSTFQKTTQIPKQVDTLFKKLDILKTFSLDTDFLKKTIIKSFAIDTRFGATQTHELSKKIDSLFKKLGITKTFSVDADFQRTQQLQRQIDVFFEKTITFSKQVDALFKKFEISKTFSLDAWFGTVGAITYTKTFGLDVVFRYKAKLPTILGITLDGQLVIPLKKEVWIGN